MNIRRFTSTENWDESNVVVIPTLFEYIMAILIGKKVTSVFTQKGTGDMWIYRLGVVNNIPYVLKHEIIKLSESK